MKTFLAGLLLAAVLTPALAGRTCEAQAPQAGSVQRAVELAERTRQALDASGADVVALARIGKDLSKYGLTWSHFGWAYRNDDGRWRVVHKLNQCGTASAALYRQGLGEFFLDDMVRFEAGLLVPRPEVQAHLLALLRDDRRVLQFDAPAYNMLAYPWSTRYQQSNQWAIETLALAQEPAMDSRERAQAWLQFQGYVPTTLRLDAFTRLGARITAANIAFDDHPNDKRFSDRIETVTVDSVFAWLQRSGLGGSVQVVR
jgi:hypothetical protein